MADLMMLKHELMLALLLLIFILLRLLTDIPAERFLRVAIGLLLINFIAGLTFQAKGQAFAGMYHTGAMIILQKNILNAGLLLLILSASRWLRQQDNLPEFFMLIVSILMGMFFMISAGHLLVFYLALELATIPLATLCSFETGKRLSSEAGMKMIMSSAFASGILLMGISLVYGLTGTLLFHDLIMRLDDSPLFWLAAILLFTGFAFKLSIVPFHLWTADVYEGSPVTVTAFLSVISKGAMVFVFTQVLNQVFRPLQEVMYSLLFIGAVLSMTAGNLLALRQQNIKRFLAFSSIAQIGFMLVGISGFSLAGTSATVFFVVIYLLSNVAAFSVAGILSTATGRETIDEYRGLYRSNRLLAWVMAIALFSLAGIPPTAGFTGKFFLLTAGASSGNYALLTIAALNMVISLAIYLRIIKAMFMEKQDTSIHPLTLNNGEKAAVWICLAGILIAGIWNLPFHFIYATAETTLP
jgi:NADH-quinone oxidoreductase subunit N